MANRQSQFFTLYDLLILPIVILVLNTYSILLRYYGGLKWVIGGLILVCIFLHSDMTRFQVSKTQMKSNAAWFVCILYLWLGVLYSSDRASTITHCTLISIYSMILMLRKPKRFYQKLFYVFELVLILSACSIYMNVIIPNLMTDSLSFLISPAAVPNIRYEVSKGIYSGIFADHANAAFAMNIGFAIQFSKYLSEKKRKDLVASILFFGTLFFTGKRSLMAIPVIMICVSMLMIVKNKRMKQTMIGVMVLLVLLFGVVSTVPSINHLFFRDSNDLWNSRTTVLWPIAIRMFLSSKFLGTGFNTFNSIIGMNNRHNATLSDWGYHAHNIYVQIIAETGILGALLLFYVFFKNYKKTVKLLKGSSAENYRLLSISLLIQTLWLVYGITGNTFYYPSQLLCYLVAIGTMEAVHND